MSTARTRRAVLSAGLAAGSAAALGGCAMGGAGNGAGGGSTGLGKDGDGKRGPVEGSISVWSWDVAAEALKRLAADFTKSHPGTKVKVVDIGYDNAKDKITVGLRGNQGLADVITVEGQSVASYTGNFPRGFHDLTAYVARYGADFDRASWRTVTDANGAIRAVPWDIGPCALFYRSDHYRQAGVTPASVETWDDFVAAGEVIRRKTGHKMLIMDTTDDSLFPVLLQQQGQHYFKGGKVAVATPEAVRALTLIKSLYDKDLVDFQKGWDGLVTATKAGKATTTPTAAWWTGTLTAEMPELKGKFGVAPLPAFTADGARTSNQGGSVLAVPAQSRNPELAWAFLEYVLTSPERQVSMLQKEGLFPAYQPSYDDPYFSAPQEYFGGQPALKVFADLAATVPPVEYTDDGAKASDVINSAVTSVLRRGTDPAKALDSAAAQIASATGRERVA